MPRSKESLVIDYLGSLVESLGPKQRHEKVYHELRESYSWEELLEEVKKGSEVGKRFVKSLSEAASKEKVSLNKFLRLGS